MFGFEVWLGKERIVEIDDFYIFDSELECEQGANDYILENLDENDYLIVVVEL